MTEIEHRSQDMLPTLGCSLSLLEARVSNEVTKRYESSKDRIVRNVNYFVENGNPRSTEVTNLFNDRVSKLLQLYKAANNSEANEVLTPGLRNALEGAAVLQLVFSRNNEIGGREPVRGQNFLPAVQAVCEDSDYKGIITVDFTDPKILERFPKEQFYQKTGRPYNQSNSGIRNLVMELAEKTGKPAIIIVDGYGEVAAELGFLISDDFYLHRQFGTKIVRSSQEQIRADRSYGSVWFGKAIGVEAGAQSKTPEQQEAYINGREALPFDPKRCREFIGALDLVSGRVIKGEEVCLQAPNNYGKSTVLLQFALGLGEGGGKSDIAVTSLGEDGVLRYSATSQDITFDETIKEVQTIIVDEAGREDKPGNTAKGMLEALQAQGKKIVRVYPGNVRPPSNYEIVKVGNS